MRTIKCKRRWVIKRLACHWAWRDCVGFALHSYDAWLAALRADAYGRWRFAQRIGKPVEERACWAEVEALTEARVGLRRYVGRYVEGLPQVRVLPVNVQSLLGVWGRGDVR